MSLLSITNSAIGILIVDDQPIFRKTLRLFIERDPQLKVLAEAGNGIEAIEATGVHRPQVALMDINMPQMGGLEATQIIAAKFPGVRIIMLTMHNDAHMEALSYEAGACKFLCKDCSTKDLIAAIKNGQGHS